MNRRAILAFATRGAAARSAAYATTATYDGRQIPMAFSGTALTGRLGDGGELISYDRVARVRTCHLPVTPTTGETLVEDATGQRFRIEKVTTHATNPEIVLSLMQA